jgi:predicted acetyltransferase
MTSPVHEPARHAVALRTATSGDMQAIASLYNLAYPSPDFNPDWISQRFQNNERFPFPDSLNVAQDADRIVGMCVTMPLEVYSHGGGILPMQGISTVAVSPLQRGQGIGSSLMRHCLQVAHAAGTPIVSCFPFEYAYYSRFGFAPVGRSVRYQFPPQTLPPFPEGRQVRLLDADDIDEICALNDRYHSQQGVLTPRRSRHAWYTWWPWYRFQAIGYPAQGPLEGFMLYDYVTIADHRLQHEAVVRDFVALTPRAERAFYGYFAGLTDQVRTITMVVPEGDPLPLLWTEQRLRDGKSVRRGDFTTGETLMGLTLRISHVPHALCGRTYNGANGSLVLEITDSELPENMGPWRLSLAEGVATVEAAPDATPDLACDVLTLASLWSGALSVTAAWRWGRVEISDPAMLPLLDDAFRTPSAPFVPEFDTF